MTSYHFDSKTHKYQQTEQPNPKTPKPQNPKLTESLFILTKLFAIMNAQDDEKTEDGQKSIYDGLSAAQKKKLKAQRKAEAEKAAKAETERGDIKPDDATADPNEEEKDEGG